MSNTKVLQTVEWAIEMAKIGNPIISDNIVPTLKEKGMRLLSQKLAKRGIQVWWSQISNESGSVILPRGLKANITIKDGFKGGHVMRNGNVMMLPIMKA